MANRAKVSQWPGQKSFWPPPFKADIVLKTVFCRAKRYHFHRLAGFGRPLANGLDPPVAWAALALTKENLAMVLDDPG